MIKSKQRLNKKKEETGKKRNIPKLIKMEMIVRNKNKMWMTKINQKI